jgi:hypothetical protein
MTACRERANDGVDGRRDQLDQFPSSYAIPQVDYTGVETARLKEFEITS